MIGVTILGCNSAIAAYGRNPTAQIITINNTLLLFDCGEGTQNQITKYKIKRNRIAHIFISHLHGDHYFGLIGLITSFSLMGRTNSLHIYAPKPLQKIIELQLQAANVVLSYPLHFTAIEEEKILLENNKFLVESFATNHRIECYGFIVREKKVPRKLDKQKALLHNIPVAYYEALKQGSDYKNKQGEIIKNSEVTVANSPSVSYAFCADTLYDEHVIESIKNVTMAYHETTYLQTEEQLAFDRFHTTSKQAAMVASKANVGTLIIGHFSSKYSNTDLFLEEAKALFGNTFIAIEGITFTIEKHHIDVEELEEIEEIN